jgi:hypothetical protein
MDRLVYFMQSSRTLGAVDSYLSHRIVAAIAIIAR